MKSQIASNDPRLTAYALGEMTAAERAAFEPLLQADPTATAFVAEIRETASILSDALDREPTPDRVIEPPTLRVARPRRNWLAEYWTLWLPLGAAAGFAIFHFAGRPPVAPANTVAAIPPTPAVVASVAPAAAPTSPATPPKEAPLSTVVATDPAEPSERPAPVVDEFDRNEINFAKVEYLNSTNLALLPPEKFELRSNGDRTVAPPAAPTNAQLAGLNNRTGRATTDDQASATFGRAPASVPTDPTPPGLNSAPKKRTVPGGRSGAGGRRVPFAAAVESSSNTDRAPVAAHRSTPTEIPAKAPSEVAGAAPIPGTVFRSNRFVPSAEFPVSHLSPMIGASSLDSIRQALRNGQMPDVQDVRIEELLNHFTTRPAKNGNEKAFRIESEVRPAPWAPQHELLRVTVRPPVVDPATRPAVNLVFLVDISGSMQREGRLPLVQEMISRLGSRLRPTDRFALVAYGDSGGVVQASTPVERPAVIREALARLSTATEPRTVLRLQQAYDLARAGFIAGGANRVVLCTDEDRHIEFSDPADLKSMLSNQAKAGISLAALSFGQGKVRDPALEEIAAAGDGPCVYLDSPADARRFIVDQFAGSVGTDQWLTGLQVEFDPAVVASHRLLGFEHGATAGGDSTSAGAANPFEAGPARVVTALYELVPAVPGSALSRGRVRVATATSGGKLPPSSVEAPIDFSPADTPVNPEFQFLASVAGFGLMLQDSPHKGALTWDLVEQLARSGVGTDDAGHRAEFLSLIQRARRISPQK